MTAVPTPPSAQDDVCSNCHGTGWDQTWHEGATCAESHACGYCRGGTYSGRPLPGRPTPNAPSSYPDPVKPPKADKGSRDA